MAFKKIIHKALNVLVLVSFVSGQVLPSAMAAQPSSVLNLPMPGAMVGISPSYVPIAIKGIKIFPDNPFRFDFLLDTGNSKLDQQRLNEETKLLIKYFLTALTVPDQDQWVNLSPYENDRIVPNEFGITEMGRDLLAQDYLLKQLTASLVYPEHELGRKFWDTVYRKAYEKYGDVDIPVSTFNKVWVMPDHATVYEYGNTAVITESRLKVLLEEDYLALQKSSSGQGQASTVTPGAGEGKDVNSLGSQIVRDIVLPEIEREINEGKNFAKLRQIYRSMIMASWFKRKLRNGVLGKIYVGANKVSGVDVDDKQIKQKIYDQYLAAYKKGVYNYIREDVNAQTQEVIPRKYFSGGALFGAVLDRSTQDVRVTRQQQEQAATDLVGDSRTASIRVDPVNKSPEVLSPSEVSLPEDAKRRIDDNVGFMIDLVKTVQNTVAQRGGGVYQHWLYVNDSEPGRQSLPEKFRERLEGIQDPQEIRYLAKVLEEEWKNNGFDKDFGSVFEYVAQLISDYVGTPAQIKKSYAWLYTFLGEAKPLERSYALRLLVVSFINHLRRNGLHPENERYEFGLTDDKFPLDMETLLGNTRDLTGPQILQRYILDLLELQKTAQWTEVIAGVDGQPNRLGLTHEDMLLWALVLAVDPTVYYEGIDEDSGAFPKDQIGVYLSKYFGEKITEDNAGIKFLQRAFNHESLKDKRPQIEALLMKALGVSDSQWAQKGQRSPYHFAFNLDNMGSIFSGTSMWEPSRVLANPMLMFGFDFTYWSDQSRMMLQPSSNSDRHPILMKQKEKGLRPLYVSAFTSQEMITIFPNLAGTLRGEVADLPSTQPDQPIAAEVKAKIDEGVAFLIRNVKTNYQEKLFENALDSQSLASQMRSRLRAIDKPDQIRLLARTLDAEWKRNDLYKELGSVFEFVAQTISADYVRPSQFKESYEWLYTFLEEAEPLERAMALRLLVISFVNHLRVNGLHPENDKNEVGLSDDKFPLDIELLLGNKRDLQGEQIFQRYILSLLELQETGQWGRVISDLQGQPNKLGLTNEDMFLWSLVLLVDPSLYYEGVDGNSVPFSHAQIGEYLSKYFGETVDNENTAGVRFLERAFSHESLRDKRPQIEKLLIKALSISEEQWTAKGQRSPYDFAFQSDNLELIFTKTSIWNKALQVVENPMLMLSFDFPYWIESIRERLKVSADGKRYLVLRRQGKDGLRPLYGQAFSSTVLNTIFPDLAGSLRERANSGGALKDLSVYDPDMPSPEPAAVLLEQWKAQSLTESIQTLTIAGQEIWAKIVEVDNMPNGITAYHFIDLDKTLVIVIASGIEKGEIRDEVIFHEAMEARWSEVLTAQAGQPLSAAESAKLKRDVHILAWAEQVAAFGQTSLTPLHQHQLAQLSANDREALRAEKTRAYQDTRVQRYFPKDRYEEYLKYKQRFQYALTKSVSSLSVDAALIPKVGTILTEESLQALAQLHQLNVDGLKRMLPIGKEVTADDLRSSEILGRLLNLEDGLAFGLKGGGVLATSSSETKYVLMQMFKDIPVNLTVEDEERLIETLVRMRDGSLQILNVMGVLTDREFELLNAKDSTGLKNLSRESKTEFLNRLAALVRSYDGLAKTSKSGLMIRLVPLTVVDHLTKYFGSSKASIMTIIRGQPAFHRWLPAAERKVADIQAEVGGARNAWIIVQAQGIEKTDDWVQEAKNLVTTLQKAVGSEPVAWQIIIIQGIDGAKKWVAQARTKVLAIQDKVGGSANAWQIVIRQGIDNVDAWVKRSVTKLAEILPIVGSETNAWLILIGLGPEKVDSWIESRKEQAAELQRSGQLLKTVWRNIIRTTLFSDEDNGLANGNGNGGALKDLSVFDPDKPAPEPTAAILEQWKARASKLSVQTLTIAGQEITAKIVEVESMSEGMTAYHFSEPDKTLVIVIASNIKAGEVRNEVVFHEAMEANWSELLRGEMGPDESAKLQRDVHILAWAEQVAAFGQTSLTPLHQQQIALLSVEDREALKAEQNRAYQDGVVKQYFPKDRYEEYLKYKQRFQDALNKVLPVTIPAVIPKAGEKLTEESLQALAQARQLDAAGLKRLLPIGEIVTEEYLDAARMLGQLLNLAEYLEFRQQGGLLAKDGKTVYVALNQMLNNYSTRLSENEKERVALVLARMREGSLRILNITGVISDPEFDILVAKDGQRLERLTPDAKENLIRRLTDLVRSYDVLASSNRKLMINRLVPMRTVDLLQKYFDLNRTTILRVVGSYTDFPLWIQKAQTKAAEIQGQVGGVSYAWIILTHQGITKVDEWVEEAKEKVMQIQDYVGGASNAWLIILNQGLSKVDGWVREAQAKVTKIQAGVGGPNIAWRIVISQGVVKTDAWVVDAQKKVAEIQGRVGGSGNAWIILTRQGIDDVDGWVREAQVKVAEIKDKVGGESHAWLVLLGQGVDNADRWVEEAQKKVAEIQDRAGNISNAWRIVISYGIDNVDQWVQEAQAKVDKIQGRVGGTVNAWNILHSQGIDKTDEWVRVAQEKVTEFQKRVAGPSNAWRIVIAQGIDNTDGWVKEAQTKVINIQGYVRGASNAWRIVISRGIDNADEWAREAEKKVAEIGTKAGSPGNAWRIVISQGIDKAVGWLLEAQKKVSEIQDRVGGTANAWDIVIGQGISKADAWVKAMQSTVNSFQAEGQTLNMAWREVIARTYPVEESLAVDDVGALKRIGILNEDQSAQVPTAVLDRWKTLAENADLQQVEIAGQTITAKIITSETDNANNGQMPDGLFAYRFRDGQGDLVIVLSPVLGQIEAMRSEAIYHEFREDHWETALRQELIGQTLSPEQIEEILWKAHVLAAAEESIAFSKDGSRITPYHAQQIESLSPAERGAMLEEDRFAQHQLIRQSLGQDQLDVFMNYEELIRAELKKLDAAVLNRDRRGEPLTLELEAERFGARVDLGRVMEEAAVETLGYVPLFSVFGSYAYLRASDGSVDWDHVGDLDIRIHARKSMSFEQYLAFKTRLFEKLGQVKGLTVDAKGIDDFRQARETQWYWGVRDGKTNDTLVFNMQMGDLQDVFDGSGSFMSYRVTDMFFGDLAQLDALMRGLTESDLLTTSVKFYRETLSELKAPLVAPHTRKSVLGRLKTLYQLAVMRGMGEEYRWLIGEMDRFSDQIEQKVLDMVELGRVTGRALKGLDVPDEVLRADISPVFRSGWMGALINGPLKVQREISVFAGIDGAALQNEESRRNQYFAVRNSVVERAKAAFGRTLEDENILGRSIERLVEAAVASIFDALGKTAGDADRQQEIIRNAKVSLTYRLDPRWNNFELTLTDAGEGMSIEYLNALRGEYKELQKPGLTGVRTYEVLDTMVSPAMADNHWNEIEVVTKLLGNPQAYRFTTGRGAQSSVNDYFWQTEHGTRITIFGRSVRRPAQQESSSNIGGIDMNSNALDLKTEGQGVKFDMPFDPARWENVQIEGFTPVILQINTTNLPAFIGSNEPDKTIQLSSV